MDKNILCQVMLKRPINKYKNLEYHNCKYLEVSNSYKWNKDQLIK